MSKTPYGLSPREIHARIRGHNIPATAERNPKLVRLPSLNSVHDICLSMDKLEAAKNHINSLTIKVVNDADSVNSGDFVTVKSTRKAFDRKSSQ